MTVRRSRAYLGLGANLGDAEATLAWSIGGLMDRLDELPHATPITVLCKSGARASIAASLLDAAGCEVRLVSRGGVPGVPDVLAACPPPVPPKPSADRPHPSAAAPVGASLYLI